MASTRAFSITFLISTLLTGFGSAGSYQLEDSYIGNDFASKFTFFNQPDPTNGHVAFQSLQQATAAGLIFQAHGHPVSPVAGADGTIGELSNITGRGEATQNNLATYIGVDHKSQSQSGRAAIRMSSTKTYNKGLFVADIAHMPGGICGVWPAFWMFGADWPNQGEIDIVEGVNTQVGNQMTLHTNAGCSISNGKMTGSINTTNCDVNASDQSKNAGCGITSDDARSYGAGFNANNGGVYATEWTSKFIKIWFFPRNAIPSDLASGKPNPDGWSEPMALFAGECDIDQHFKDLNIIFDTTFCGDWAGKTWASDPTCMAKAPTCEQYVSNNPEAFTEAYWLVNSVKTYQAGAQSYQTGA